MRSIVSSKYQGVVRVLRTSACDMVKKVSESIERSTSYIVTRNASLSSVHEDACELEPVCLSEFNSRLRLVVRFEIFSLLILPPRQVLMVIGRTIERVPIRLTRHMHLKDGLQIEEEVVGYEPCIQELVPLNQVYQ